MIPHICADEIGMIAAAITFVGGMIKPVRDCLACQAVYIYNKLRSRG